MRRYSAVVIEKPEEKGLSVASAAQVDSAPFPDFAMCPGAALDRGLHGELEGNAAVER